MEGQLSHDVVGAMPGSHGGLWTEWGWEVKGDFLELSLG